MDAVSRVCCRSQRYEVDLVLDVNCELCKLNAKDTFKMVLASTLSLDGGMAWTTTATVPSLSYFACIISIVSTSDDSRCQCVLTLSSVCMYVCVSCTLQRPVP